MRRISSDQMPPELLFAAAVPIVLVSRDGRYEGTANAAQTLERWRDVLPPEAKGAGTKLMTSPAIKAIAEQSGAKQWNTWVGVYLGIEWVPGEVVSTIVDVPSPLGVSFPSNVTYEHRGAVIGAPSLVLLELRQTSSGEDIERATERILNELAAKTNAPADPGEIERLVRGMRLDRTITAALDPSTGRPHRARMEEIVGKGVRRTHKVRDTAFHWSKAEGCVAR